MAPGTAGQKNSTTKEPIKVQVLTKDIIPAIVKLYDSEDEVSKKIALELAGGVLEAYNDSEEFQIDVFDTFVPGNNNVRGKIRSMDRAFPDETKMLEEIFGAVLFGGRI